jgi:hypothetical protein
LENLKKLEKFFELIKKSNESLKFEFVVTGGVITNKKLDK